MNYNLVWGIWNITFGVFYISFTILAFMLYIFIETEIEMGEAQQDA